VSRRQAIDPGGREDAAADEFEVVSASERYMPTLAALWRAYQEFYDVPPDAIDDRCNCELIRTVLRQPALGAIFIAKLARTPIGFATIYYGLSSTRACRIALMNDIYLAPEHRRRGFGEKLIEHCTAHARSLHIPVLEWFTRTDNLAAQRLYARFSVPSQWLCYNLTTGSGSRR
jgi:GNAT superfamily N-acetyltransferase